MRADNTQDILLQKTNDLFHEFTFIGASIDNILILTEGDCKDHVQKLESMINKLKVKGLKYNIKKSFFKPK